MGLARRWLAVAGLVALAAFGTAFAEATFVHTDDGCPIEVHCLACRWAVGTIGTAPPAVFALAATLVPVGDAPDTPRLAVTEPATEPSEARGPPPQA